jgi:replicative DNA helicase
VRNTQLHAAETLNTLKAEGGVELFHNYLPKKIFNMVKSLVTEGREHEVETLEFSDPIQRSSDGREVEAKISSIRCQYAGMSWFDQHLKNLKNEAALRRATKIVSDASKAISERQTPEQLSEALRDGSRAIMGIVSSDDDLKNAKQGISEFTDMLKTIHTEGETRGMKTGIPELDAQTGGLGANELWVIGAQTSRGKTVLMFQMAATLLEAKKHVLLISLETDADRIHARLAANMESISMSKILGNSTSPIIKSDLIKLQSYCNKITENDCLHISDSDSITLESISAQADRLKEKGYPIDAIVVDYIQLVTVADTTNKARHEQVAEVTRTLKQLAKRYKCPIITASQLNDDGRARESRAISHDADVMLKINDESDGITIEKNRNGQRGYNLQLALNGENQRFQ